MAERDLTKPKTHDELLVADTLVKIAAVTGSELAINITPQGATPRLAVKAVKDTPAHVYSGASLRVAAR